MRRRVTTKKDRSICLKLDEHGDDRYGAARVVANFLVRASNNDLRSPSLSVSTVSTPLKSRSFIINKSTTNCFHGLILRVTVVAYSTLSGANLTVLSKRASVSASRIYVTTHWNYSLLRRVTLVLCKSSFPFHYNELIQVCFPFCLGKRFISCWEIQWSTRFHWCCRLVFCRLSFWIHSQTISIERSCRREIILCTRNETHSEFFLNLCCASSG